MHILIKILSYNNFFSFQNLEQEANTDLSDNDDFKPKIELDFADSETNEINDDNDNNISPPKIKLQDKQHFELLSYIIGFYCKNELLWNSNHCDYNKAKKKLHKLNMLSVEGKQFYKRSLICALILYAILFLVEVNFKQIFTCKELRQIFLNLRSLYRKELLDGNKRIKSHEETAATSKLWFFEQMEFMQQTTVVKDTYYWNVFTLPT